MSSEPSFIGMLKHGVSNAAWIANTQDADSTIDQELTNPVDRHVALRADQDLTFTPKRLANRLDKGCRLTCTRGAVDNSDVFGGKDLIDRLGLTGV